MRTWRQRAARSHHRRRELREPNFENFSFHPAANHSTRVSCLSPRNSYSPSSLLRRDLVEIADPARGETRGTDPAVPAPPLHVCLECAILPCHCRWKCANLGRGRGGSSLYHQTVVSFLSPHPAALKPTGEARIPFSKASRPCLRTRAVRWKPLCRQPLLQGGGGQVALMVVWFGLVFLTHAEGWCQFLPRLFLARHGFTASLVALFLWSFQKGIP